MENRFRRSMRFIPTYVGHTVSVYSHVGSLPVHPHLCGAYAPPSSKKCTGTRFIPTYVGHTPLCPCCAAFNAVHPHIRGAYSASFRKHTTWNGSSPHTWGTRFRHGGGKRHGRFIPTYVGHTTFSVSIMSASSVHPHIRGAYETTLDRNHEDLRFIPTYVGHTLDRRKKNGWFQPLLL